MKKDKDVRDRPSPAAIADPRFARVHTDPRFMRMPKNKTKVSIDKRFSHMFSDKNFSDPLGADKRGRAKKKKEKHVLQRYYKVGEGEDGGVGPEGKIEAPRKSKGRDAETVVAKVVNGKKLGKGKEIGRPRFPGPVAPSKVALNESDEEGDSDEEIDLKQKLKLKGKDSGKLMVKPLQGQKLGFKFQGSNLAKPKCTEPAVVEESDEEDDSDVEDDSDEEIDLHLKLKGKDLGKLAKTSKTVPEIELGDKGKGKDTAKPRTPELAEEESDEEDDSDDAKPRTLELAEEESDEEDDSDEEIDLKLKLKGKDSGKLAKISKTEESKLADKVKGSRIARPETLEPAEEESDEVEDSDEEIDLNSDESEEELERDAGVKTKNHIAQEGDDSEDEEDEDASSDSDEESSSSSSSSSSESEAEDDLDDPRAEEKVPTASGAETRRIAMMNMDWEHIKAGDLLMLMRSFQPKGGRVECVTVYPSEFGIEQMKAEQVHGPNMIFEDDDDDEDENKEMNMEKLRAYEKNKLKYYYAVVDCDSKETANHLYSQCDGMEFERTSNTLDLRFIPDDITFVRDPRDVAKEVQDGYKAPEFETRALQHSSVKLTWDDDEPTRVKALRKKFNADELNEMDFRAYLASGSSEEELNDDEDESPSSPERGDASNVEGANSKKDKYRSLLLGDSTEEVERPGQRKKTGDVDMEVTFHTGLTELSEKLMQKKEAKKRGDETVWEAYLRKKKEKKSQRKRSKNAKSDDADYSEEEVASPRAGQREADPFFSHDDNGFDDPFFAEDADFPAESKAAVKKSSKANLKDSERLKKREEKEQQRKDEERSKAELELLLMDDEGVQGAARGFNLKNTDKKKKDKRKKNVGKDEDDQEEEDKLAIADLSDPRFAPLFSDHHYAIDPTNPQFRKSAAQLKILAETQRRRLQKSDDGGDSKGVNVESDGVTPDATDAAVESQDRKRKAEISSLVRSLKRKAGKPGSVNNK